jgi:small subunit ribosomal protein S14
MARRSTMIKTTKKLKYEIRQHNRCKVCFRGRSYLRKFGLCRICFRNLALGGYIPGVGKASW